jgi:hypothetical protein
METHISVWFIGEGIIHVKDLAFDSFSLLSWQCQAFPIGVLLPRLIRYLPHRGFVYAIQISRRGFATEYAKLV